MEVGGKRKTFLPDHKISFTSKKILTLTHRATRFYFLYCCTRLVGSNRSAIYYKIERPFSIMTSKNVNIPSLVSQIRACISKSGSLQSDAIKLHSDRAKKMTGELVTVYKKMKNTYTCTNIGLLFF